MNSENPTGADNQQETASSRLGLETMFAGSSETARQAPLLIQERLKIQSDPHGDMRSQAEMTWPEADG